MNEREIWNDAQAKEVQALRDQLGAVSCGMQLSEQSVILLHKIDNLLLMSIEKKSTKPLSKGLALLRRPLDDWLPWDNEDLLKTVRKLEKFAGH